MTTIELDRLLRRTEVEDLTGFSVSTLYRKMTEGTFPQPIRLGERTVRWSSNELDEWLTNWPRGVDASA